MLEERQKDNRVNAAKPRPGILEKWAIAQMAG
jgi:hypothetical protein